MRGEGANHLKNDPNHSELSLILNRSDLSGSGLPLYRQICESVRKAILIGRLRSGVRLPSTRRLSRELGVSRNTVLVAFDQLIAEGYLVTKRGSGTFVADGLTDSHLKALRPGSAPASPNGSARTVSSRGNRLRELDAAFSSDREMPRAFQTGLTCIDEFPLEIWKRILSRILRGSRPANLDYLDYREIQGYLPLREAISRYLGLSRGLACEPERIFIVSGSQQGLDLAARVLLDKDGVALVEDPGYRGVLGALRAAEARIVPIPLDEEGFSVAEAENRNENVSAVFVTPSHHFPTGTVMSLSRRLGLLEWSNKNGVWIVEDDYDSEFRYDGRPLSALSGLDAHERVVYVGTFSKVMFPSMRLGYLVVPSDLVSVFQKALLYTSLHAPTLEQAALADFINEGHFGRHIRRMKKLYAEKQDLLAGELTKHLSDFLEVRPDNAGLSLIAGLRRDRTDIVVAERALCHGVYVAPLSFYCIESTLPGALIFGYAGVEEAEIREGVRRLRDVFTGRTA